MLTPIEIQSKTFKVGIGFDKRDVEAFFKEVLAAYEQLYKENVELNDKIGVLSEGIQYYKSIEKTLQKALVLAEKTSDDTKKAAVNEATHIEKEAKTKAKMIIADAQHELDSIHMKTISLVQQYNKYKAQFRQLAATQLELLDGESFHIDLSGYETFKQEEGEAASEDEKIETSSNHFSSSENIAAEENNEIKIPEPSVQPPRETQQSSYGYSPVSPEQPIAAAQASTPVFQNNDSNKNTYSAGIQQEAPSRVLNNGQDNIFPSQNQQASPYQDNKLANASIPSASYSNQYYNGSLPAQKPNDPFLDEFESPYISSAINTDPSSKKKEKLQKKPPMQNESPTFMDTTSTVSNTEMLQDNTIPPSTAEEQMADPAVENAPVTPNIPADIPVKENDHVDILIKELRAASKETASSKGIMNTFTSKKNEPKEDDGFNFISYDD